MYFLIIFVSKDCFGYHGGTLQFQVLLPIFLVQHNCVLCPRKMDMGIGGMADGIGMY